MEDSFDGSCEVSALGQKLDSLSLSTGWEHSSVDGCKYC